MKITRKILNDAVDESILTLEQADKLLTYLKSLPGVGATSNFTHVLYYLGGLIAIAAMTLFMNLGWESFGGWGILFICLIYIGIGLSLTEILKNKNYPVPAAICAAVVVALTPLAIYGLQEGLAFWSDKYIRWSWLYMELATLFVGLLLARRYKYPFLLMPIAATLWYMSMDITTRIAETMLDFEPEFMVSMGFGLLMILFAFWVDVRSWKKADYAFWLYVFGVMAFWGGMTFQDVDSEGAKFVVLCVNIFMLGIGAVIVRRVFVVFGALGTGFYLGHLAWDVFEESWLFPITLTAIGLSIIYLGILWQKHEMLLNAKLRSLLPVKLKEFLDSKVV